MFLPPIQSVLPAGAFNALLQRYGVRLTWLKSHLCPCTGGGSDPSGGYVVAGSPDPACPQCRGFGTYWDAPVGPFTGLLTYFASAPSPIEPGIRVDDKFGQHIETEPVVTIPYAAPTNQDGGAAATALAGVWQQAGLLDMFCEVDAVTRYNTLLYQGKNQVLPFQQNLSVATAGAVTVRDPATRAVQQVVGYQVQGAQVTLPNGLYPDGTAYAVEFEAAPIFVAHRAAGALPHSRPFGNGVTQLPRRFHIQTLDYWTRLNVANAGTQYPVCGC